MKGAMRAYQKSKLSELDGYMCIKCKKVNLGDPTIEKDEAGHVLYWLETGNQPRDGAVCVPCYFDSVPKRRQRKPVTWKK